jgi:hypothetical protein
LLSHPQTGAYSLVHAMLFNGPKQSLSFFKFSSHPIIKNIPKKVEKNLSN